MRFYIGLLVATIAVFVYTTHAQDYTKLHYEDCGSKGADVHDIAMRPMPLFNPGEAYFTLITTLKRPVQTIEVSLDILRTVNGIRLPVKCYIVNGQNVGSCTYPDLCAFLQTILTEFQPDNCPPTLAQYGIDCRCPFNVKAQKLEVIEHLLDLPDATQTAATFLASGNFNMTVLIKDQAGAAQNPYACVKVAFTVKQKK